MGYGGYDIGSRKSRAIDSGFYTSSVKDIFSSRSINNAMSPQNAKKRESCDSDEHPDSVAIVIALDLTGSMGSVPHNLVKDGLPNIVGNIQQKGIKHPQILFLGIGDHECDRAPLQVGQFESSDELMDKWLTSVYLEGGGGGNTGESYFLAWYFSAFHTVTDCFKKRGQKGFLFTIGDEPTLNGINKADIKWIMGDGQYSDYTAKSLLAEAQKTYNVYHIHVSETRAGQYQDTVTGWKSLIGNNLIISKRHTDISGLISDKIIEVMSNSVNQIKLITDKPEHKSNSAQIEELSQSIL